MGWSNSLTQRILIFVIGLYLSIYIFFTDKIIGPEWIFSSMIIITSLIFSINTLSKKWMYFSEDIFIKRLFWISFTLRLLTMFTLLIIAQNTEGWKMFYYVGAKDPQRYYRIALEASMFYGFSNLTDGFRHIYESYAMNYSDSGFSTFLMLLMNILGNSPVLIKTVLCLIGSIIVIRGYKLSALLFERNTARFAGILLMLYPVSWFYSAVLLKESLMVLFTFEVIISIVKLQRKLNIKDLLWALLFIIILFFFRSAVSILSALVLIISLTFQTSKNRSVFLSFVIVSLFTSVYLYFLIKTGSYGEYYQPLAQSDDFTESRISFMEKINPLVGLVGTPVFAAVAFVAPFPSIVKIPIEGGLSHNEYYYHIAGNLFWLIFAFFSLYGLYHCIRYQRNELAPLWIFIIGYILILLRAMMFTSVRFSYPAKPFLLILAAYGIYKMRNKKLYSIYLFGIVILIIGWNYVRLIGRGG